MTPTLNERDLGILGSEGTIHVLVDWPVEIGLALDTGTS